MNQLFFISALAITLLTSHNAADISHVDLNTFIKETQKTTTGNGEVVIAWWIPIEFWQVTFEQNDDLTEAQKKSFIKALKEYSMFAIIDGETGDFGNIDYVSDEEIKKTLSLTNSDGKTYKSLNSDDVSVELQTVLAAFKPVLKSMLGKMGENMNFYVFKDYDSKNNRICNPLDEGFVQLNFNKREVKWETPLGSLLPPKMCPIDKKPMSGGWKYCPIHGNELVAQE